MSTPRSSPAGPVRDGTRVVLKEITATLHNSTTNHPPRRKSGGVDANPVSKTTEHEVKVCFAREFADIGSVTCLQQESLSSASSFHSVYSAVSTKSSSGICTDLASDAADYEVGNNSYVSRDIPGVDDLISGCAGLHLTCEQDSTSQDLTFASAADDFVIHTSDSSLNEDLKPDNATDSKTQEDETNFHETNDSSLNETQHTLESSDHLFCNDGMQQLIPQFPAEEDSNGKSVPLKKSEDNAATSQLDTCGIVNSTVKDSLPTSNVDSIQLNVETSVSSDNWNVNVTAAVEEQVTEINSSAKALSSANSESCAVENLVLPTQADPFVQYAENRSPLSDVLPPLITNDNNVKEDIAVAPADSVKSVKDSAPIVLSFSSDNDQKLSTSITVNITETQAENSQVVEEENLSQLDDSYVVSCNKENDTQILDETSIVESHASETLEESLQASDATSDTSKTSTILNETQIFLSKEDIAICNEIQVTEEQRDTSEIIIIQKEKSPVVSESSTGAVKKEKSFDRSDLDSTLTLQEIDIDLAASDEEQYVDFKPQRQSITLSQVKEQQPDLDKVKSESGKFPNDLTFSPEFAEDQFIPATSEIFQDPSTFDFLLAQSNTRRTPSRFRTESLYVKFDPLVSSMLPQGNAQPSNEEQNGKNELPLPDVDTPKRNPAIAAIDRLLFYSPLPSGTAQKLEEAQEKNEQPVEEPKCDAPLIADINIAKELELVRSTVLQLEEELEKKKKEHEVELDRQKMAFQEKLDKLQTQMAQEVKTKTQMTVVVEEYEKSISRLLTERERDRTHFEQEKMKLQEELQAANHHLTNTEAAFNDVHQKYERLKGVVSVYKNNETVLKESIQENVDTIKTLETRYEQLKDHAMTQLEKANLELDGITKQHEAETVKLHAMIRKAELKSNSLAELVEQKTKENKELTKILDEVIARVGHGNQE